MTSRPIISPQKKVDAAIVKNAIRMLESEIYKIKANQNITYQRLDSYTRVNIPNMQLNIRWIESAPSFDINEIVQKAKTDSIMVRKQKELVMATAQQLLLSKRNVYPDISILFNYDYEKIADKEQSVSGGISIPLPLYNQNQDQIDAAEPKVKQELQMMQYIEKLIETDISTISKNGKVWYYMSPSCNCSRKHWPKLQWRIYSG